jgi:hypothetical protein
MILRKCKQCFKEATNEEELKFFAKHKRNKYGRENRCVECKQKDFKDWQNKNKNYRKEYHVKNKEKENSNSLKWILNNKEQALSNSRKYQAKKYNAIPKWFNKTEVDLIYKQAKMLNLEVDHIVPLQSNYVCGLHVQNNLQLLSSVENKSKSNLTWEHQWKRTA